MRMIGPYEIGTPLARGGHAVVHVARRSPEPHRAFAAKVARRGDEAVLHHENACLRRVEHPNLVAPVAFVDDGLDAALVLPLAACSLGALHARLRVDELMHVLHGVVAAMGALHDADLVHRDVAPQNILLTDDATPLLADLGQVRRADADAVRRDIASLARCGLALLAPAGGDVLRSLLETTADGATSIDRADAFAEALHGTGIEPAAPNPHATVPVSVEPPTTAIY